MIGDQKELRKLVWAGSIAFNPNLDIIAIADSYNSQVHLYNSDLAYKCSMGIKQILEPGTTVCPREVAFGYDGTCYLTMSTRYVLTFDSDGMYIGKWSAVSPQYNPSNTEDTELRGLTVNSIEQVLVGEIKLKYISKHKSDGCHVKSFEVDITPRSIAVTSKGAIIISDRNKSIHIVDHT